jgi:hypothetical protein
MLKAYRFIQANRAHECLIGLKVKPLGPSSAGLSNRFPEELTPDAAAPHRFGNGHFGNLKLPRTHRQQSAAADRLAIADREEDSAAGI